MNVTIRVTIGGLLLVIHLANCILKLVELNRFYSRPNDRLSAALKIKDEYLKSKWKIERDANAACYVAAVYIAIGACTVLLSKIESYRSELRAARAVAKLHAKQQMKQSETKKGQ